MSRDPIEDAIARMVIAANERGWDMEQALDAGMCEALAKAALADTGTRAAAQREREECAKVADARAEICKDALEEGDKMEVHTLNEALHIAAAIRARKG